MGKTSESRIKRITQITRITPHIPTTALSFPSAMSFVHPAAIRLRDGNAQVARWRGEERTRRGGGLEGIALGRLKGGVETRLC